MCLHDAWPAKDLASLSCPVCVPSLTCGSSPRLSPGTSAMCSLARSLSLSLPLESRDLNPSPGFDCHLYISPKPGAKFTIFLPESACPTLQLASFQSLHCRSSVGAAPHPSLILESFSFPLSSISPKTSANISFHLSPRHTWPLLYALN